MGLLRIPANRPFAGLVLRALSNATHRALDALCPERCVACRVTHGSALFCSQCSPSKCLPGATVSRMIDLDECEIPAYAPFLYSNEVVRAAIHRFKFDSHPELARRMAPLMLSALPHDLLPNLWVPVPLSRDELPKRGYNQSALLASELAKTTLSVCAPRLIRRKTGMSHQRKLARSARLANPVDAFTLAQARLVSSPARTPSGIPTVTPSGIPTMPCAQSTSVVLVDDVLTTGATARACCRVLNAAGLRPIAILTFAQVPPPEGKGVRISLSAAGG